jgi:hypothetical protein
MQCLLISFSESFLLSVSLSSSLCSSSSSSSNSSGGGSSGSSSSSRGRSSSSNIVSVLLQLFCCYGFDHHLSIVTLFAVGLDIMAEVYAAKVKQKLKCYLECCLYMCVCSKLLACGTYLIEGN